MKKIFKIIGGIVGIIATVAALGAVVMYLWNGIVPTVIGWGTITYWQAFGLLVLCKLLFGGFRCKGNGCHRHKGRHFRKMKEKWNDMSEDERCEFIKKRHFHPFGNDSQPKSEHGGK
ncbi:MAG: hypothetical protein LBS52_05425 [Dysgonamonadaceae bacterium]|jgi:hypothetical protein|nr:hypothetical protein [Dysgonamonadaceae bacterium]